MMKIVAIAVAKNCSYYFVSSKHITSVDVQKLWSGGVL